MITDGGCLAVIPARGGSKGLPDKNIRILAQKPLIEHSIVAALNSRYIQEVVVTTDSSKIAEVAKQAGASVPFLRPSELSTDTARSIDAVKHAVGFYEEKLKRYFSHIILLQPTSPLRQSFDIDQAFEVLLQNDADSLQSVCEAETHPYLLRTIKDDHLTPYLAHEMEHKRRQDLDHLYALNGAIYIVKRDVLMRDDALIGVKNCGYVMPRERSVDIDSEMDLKLAEFYLSLQCKED